MLLKVLLSGKADVNTKDEDGNTALHHATGLNGFLIEPGEPDNLKRYSFYETRIKLLLAFGADPSIANNNGFTPYEVVLNSWDAHGEPEGGVGAAAAQKALCGINHVDEAQRLCREFCTNFTLTPRSYGNLTGFSVNDKADIIVVHPFWNEKSDTGLLAEAKGKASSPDVSFVDNFNLLRRPSYVYKNLEKI